MAARVRQLFGGRAQAAPFLKWAGGKGQLLAQLVPLLPSGFGRYVEPFLGGGAFFFHLHNIGLIERGAILNDANAELMNCYSVIQDAESVPELVRRLRSHARRSASADYYYRVRGWDRAPDFLRRRSPVERAARTIFLNHTCYNGLFRLNSRGQFNVPYGRWRRPPSIFDEENLWACHEALQGVQLECESFDACARWAGPGDFVYLNHPYCPLSPTASFTTYTGSEFGEDEQRRLARLYRELAGRGCLLMLSNSATPLVRRLYSEYRIVSVFAARAINSRAAGRGKIEELVVLNY